MSFIYMFIFQDGTWYGNFSYLNSSLCKNYLGRMRVKKKRLQQKSLEPKSDETNTNSIQEWVELVKKYHGIRQFLSYEGQIWQKQCIVVLVCVSDMCRCRALYDGDTSYCFSNKHSGIIYFMYHTLVYI